MQKWGRYTVYCPLNQSVVAEPLNFDTAPASIRKNDEASTPDLTHVLKNPSPSIKINYHLAAPAPQHWNKT
jgi:hypothetical protein